MFGNWILEHFLPAAALTYVVVGSEPLALPRALLQLKYPRSLGALVGCAACTGFWMGLLVGAGRVYFGQCDFLHMVGGALTCTGALWIVSAVTGAIEARAKPAPMHFPVDAGQICPSCGWVEPAASGVCKVCPACGASMTPDEGPEPIPAGPSSDPTPPAKELEPDFSDKGEVTP